MGEPYCLAMVLCDALHRDPATGKCTIIGTCHSFAAIDFPTSVRFFVYSAITDGLGPLKLSLRLVTSDYSLGESGEEGVVFEVESNEVNLESRLAVVETCSEIQARIEKPGQYHCELYANGHLLTARRLLVMKPIEE